MILIKYIKNEELGGNPFALNCGCSIPIINATVSNIDENKIKGIYQYKYSETEKGMLAFQDMFDRTCKTTFQVGSTSMQVDIGDDILYELNLDVEDLDLFPNLKPLYKVIEV